MHALLVAANVVVVACAAADCGALPFFIASQEEGRAQVRQPRRSESHDRHSETAPSYSRFAVLVRSRGTVAVAGTAGRERYIARAASHHSPCDGRFCEYARQGRRAK